MPDTFSEFLSAMAGSAGVEASVGFWSISVNAPLFAALGRLTSSQLKTSINAIYNNADHSIDLHKNDAFLNISGFINKLALTIKINLKLSKFHVKPKNI